MNKKRAINLTNKSHFFRFNSYVRVFKGLFRIDPTSGRPAVVSRGPYVRLIKSILSKTAIDFLKNLKYQSSLKELERHYLKVSDQQQFLSRSHFIGSRQIPAAFTEANSFSELQLAEMSQFLESVIDEQYAEDLLWSHMDKQGDVTGKIIENLLVLQKMKSLTLSPKLNSAKVSSKVIFDARCLQDPGYRDRGIGYFAKFLLESVRQNVSEEELFLVVDASLPKLKTEFASNSPQIATTKYLNISEFAVLIQPSPMTYSQLPLVDALEKGIFAIAVVYDFIPPKFPAIYLPNSLSWTSYIANLRVLEKYDTLLAISDSVKQDIHSWIPEFSKEVKVCWPNNLIENIQNVSGNFHHVAAENYTLLIGDEPRKNLYGALRLLKKTKGKVNVIGMSSQPDNVKKVAKAVGISLERINILPRVDENTKLRVLGESTAVVVLSFAEGLSLPVIEAVSSGAPVLASNIPPHKELLGVGKWLPSWSISRQFRALKWIKNNRNSVVVQQSSNLMSAIPDSLENTISEQINLKRMGLGDASTINKKNREVIPYISASAQKLKVGICTPWEPQPTGVAHYSSATLPALSELVDLTVYAPFGSVDLQNLNFRSVSNGIVSGTKNDINVSVMGNSYFHLQMNHFLEVNGGVALCHDSAMLDFYDDLVGEKASLNMQQLSKDSHTREIYEKTGHLENLNFADLASKTEGLLFHSKQVAQRVAMENNSPTGYVPFTPLRRPDDKWTLAEAQSAARKSYCYTPGKINIVSLGYLSNTRKLSSTLVNACLLLREQGVDIQLTFVGSGSEEEINNIFALLNGQSSDWLKVTGYVDDDEMIQYLVAADLFVQLRLGDVQMMSGPVFDAASFGAAGVVTGNLSDNGNLPSYISQIPNKFTFVELSEILYNKIHSPLSLKIIEEERKEFLIQRNPKQYALKFIECLEGMSLI